jgi:hypothetical protein
VAVAVLLIGLAALSSAAGLQLPAQPVQFRQSAQQVYSRLVQSSLRLRPLLELFQYVLLAFICAVLFTGEDVAK